MAAQLTLQAPLDVPPAEVTPYLDRLWNGVLEGASGAATFTLGSGSTARTFVALNDGVAGFQATADTLLEITGYAGDLRGLAVI